MVLRITGLNELRERLERLRPEEVMARALAEQAARMADRVREGLSEAPGGPGHDEPWLQSGELRNSVGSQADGLQAAVGSSDPAAVPQELGTAHMPARPFLAPVAAGMGEELARAVGTAMAAALRGDSTYGDTSGVQLISDSGEHTEDPDDAPAKKDLEFPGHTHTHTPQPMPGLNSPFPTIPLPITPGGNRNPIPAAPRPVAPNSAPVGRRENPIKVAPGTNQRTVIDGRLYTGHALDRMQGRGIPPSAVEEAIQHGRKAPGNTPDTTVHIGDNGVVAVTGSDGQVITVITR